MNEDQMQIFKDKDAHRDDLREVISDVEQELEVLRLRLADVIEWNNRLLATPAVPEITHDEWYALQNEASAYRETLKDFIEYGYDREGALFVLAQNYTHPAHLEKP